MVNYEMVYVICPIGCDKDFRIFGRNIYSPTSTVCAAGIIDGSMPYVGGLMGITRMNGQGSYGTYKKTKGISI